ncbi:MAG: CapA family protein [Lachnospiraceae bacterium]|nr:CapA family protein [Erysipelotrichaceae bacterium]MBR4342409.1 CapA family protein [Lachnospiraceae bacterium]
MSTSIVFTGDICFTQYFKDINSNCISEDIKEFVYNTDYCVGNIEGAVFSLTEEKEKKEFLHYSDERAAKYLSDMGINVWNLANNHIFDFNETGISETIKNCLKYNCNYVGITEKQEDSHFIIHKEGGIGLLSITYSERNMIEYNGKYSYIDWNSCDIIQREINKIKETNRWCILIVHGGEEFSCVPMPETRKKYINYLNMGADFIIAHHPHVLQEYEIIGNKIIFYSLGNYIFDTDFERIHKHTDKGVIVKLNFDHENVSWEYKLTKIDRKTNRLISSVEESPIFININYDQYEKIWPFAARALAEEEKSTLIYLKPEQFKRRYGLKWYFRDVRLFRHKKLRKQIIGKYRSLFMKQSNMEIMEYLLK